MEYNAYFWIAFIAVVGFYALDTWASWLNSKAAQAALPKEFQGIFDADEYNKSQTYTQARTRFGLQQDTFSLVLFLAFWLLGGFGWLDHALRGLGFGEIVNGILFIGILFVAQTLISIPFDLYDTFVIEERFGFNKTTVGVFFGDLAKMLVLTVLIGVPLLTLLLWLFETVPNAWAYGWALVTVFSLVMTYLAPRLIMPLFNKFAPLEDGELKTAIHQLSDKCDFPVTEVSVMDGSKRSSKSNAFFTGFGKHKRIALFDTLIAGQTVPELVAVLAHEIGHFKKKHIIQQMALSILQIGLVFFLIYLLLKNESLMKAFGVDTPSVYCSFVFFMIIFKPVSRLISIGMTMLSRKNEFEADAYAAASTGSAEELISALKKLSKDNLSNLTPHPFYVFMFYSHPPVLQRIAALRSWHGT